MVKKNSPTDQSKPNENSEFKDEINKTSDNKILDQFNSPLFLELQNPVSLEIFTLLLIYRELSMTQITIYIQKSKPTVFRHLKKMLELGLVRESREQQKKRGDLPIKFFTADLSALQRIPNVTPAQTQQFDPQNKLKFFEAMRDLTITTSQFSRSMLQRFEDFFIHLDSKPGGPFQTFMESMETMDLNDPKKLPPMSLNLNLLSANQYQKYLVAYKEFMIKIMGELIEEEKANPNAIKPYLMLYSVLPITQIFGKRK